MKKRDKNIIYDAIVYKKDTSGKLRQNRLWATSDGYLCQETGVVDGKLIYRESFRKGKNEGKSNETSPSEQAVKEAKAKIKNKLRDGYFLLKTDAMSHTSEKPMLAQTMSPTSLDEEDFPVACQPKIDGVRASQTSSSKGKLISRKNLEITTVDHLTKELKKLQKLTGFDLDGELYIHGEPWQLINSKVSKVPTKEDISENPKLAIKLRYWIYDYKDIKTNFFDRIKKLESIFSKTKFTYIKLLQTDYANSYEEIEVLYNKYIESGYEGLMVRKNALYDMNKRSKNLLKVKSFIDKAYTLVDVTPADKDPLRGVPVVKIEPPIPLEDPLRKSKINWYSEGEERVEVNINGIPHGYALSRCGTKLSDKERYDLLLNKNKYIGKTAEIRFFEFYESGVPRFPQFLGIRTDK